MKYKIYLKAYITCLAIIILVEFINFGLFSTFVERNLTEQMRSFTDERLAVLRDIVEHDLNDNYPVTGEEIDTFNADLAKIAQIMPPAKIWVSSDEGIVHFRSFDGPVPEINPGKLIRFSNSEWIAQMTETGSPFVRYPLTVLGHIPGHLNILFTDQNQDMLFFQWNIYKMIMRYSLLGFVIGLVLLIIPFRYFIGKPLIALSESVTEMSKGNLKARCEIGGQDEIWDIGVAFNSMADTIEGMIEGAKELTTNISHEIRTPLARISLTEGILRERLSDNPRFELYLDNIQEEIGEIDILVGQILELSRLDFNKVTGHKEILDLVELTQECIHRFESSMDHKGIEFRCTLPEEAAPIMAIRKDIVSAISNLMDNAVKFTPQGGEIEFRIKLFSDRVDLTIANTCNIENAEDLQKIFEPFHRLSQTEETGTGLGLAITRKVINNHGGDMLASRWMDGIKISIQGLPLARIPSETPEPELN